MNASPPGPDISKGALVVGITTFLHIISLSLFGARIYTRVRPTLRLGLDDYFLALAVLFDITEWVLLLIGVHYGVGRHNYYLTPYEMEQAEKFLFISQPPYAWALAFAKLSIIWMLIRIQRDHKAWTIFLYIMMAFVTLTSVTMNVFQFSLCKPLSAIWDHSVPNPVCLPPAVGQMSIYVTAAMTIVTDFTLSLLPLSFIVHIQRPWREKVALACVMGLGVIASSASIAKTTLVKDYGITGDDLMDSVGITIWSILEVQLAIAASCIPTLKQLFEKVLRQFGVISSANSRSRTGYWKHGEDNTGGSHGLKSMRTTKRDVERDVDSEVSAKPAYFRTTCIADAQGETMGSQEHIIGHHDAQGIQVGHVVSVRSSLKASDDDV